MATQAEKLFSIGRPVRIPKALREELEAAIQAHLTAVEKLIAVLDKANGDPELEPSLGSYPYGTPAHLTDCESDVVDEPHDEADEGDSEPSLGSLNCIGSFDSYQSVIPGFDQSRWAHGSRLYDDAEDEHDGAEPDDREL